MSSLRSSIFWPILTAVIGITMIFIALPASMKKSLPPYLRGPTLHYGLDLAGGTQLDFRISEKEIEDELNKIDQEIAAAKKQQNSSDRVSNLELQRRTIEDQRKNLVEAIRMVIERRINALGVAESTITPSYVGNERHLLVDCPGIIDVQQCIDTVGKTIQLEFKEEQREADPAYEKTVRQRAEDAYRQVTVSGATLKKVGQDFKQLGVSYIEDQLFYEDELPKGLEGIWKRTPKDPLWKREGEITQEAVNPQGARESETIAGVFLAEVLAPKTATGRTVNNAPEAFALVQSEDKKSITYTVHDLQDIPSKLDANIATALRTGKPGDLKAIASDDGTARIIFLRQTVPGREVVDVRHILVAFSGAQAAPKNVTRTKEEALKKAKELQKKLQGGADFASLATKESDGTSGKDGGKLPAFSRGTLGDAFDAVAFSQKENVISNPTETPFGYHIIRVDRAPHRLEDQAAYDELIIKGDAAKSRADDLVNRMQQGKIMKKEDAIRLRMLFFSLKPTGWKDTPLNGKHFRSASVTTDPNTHIPVVQIVFDDEGGKMFAELTKRNIGKRIGIFVGGEFITDPVVQSEISNGTAIITGDNDFQKARQLAQDLNTGSIPAPIYLAGQQTVEPTLGEEALAASLNASLIGLVIVAVYMVLMYGVLGLVADITLAIYALLLIVLMKLPLLLVTNQHIVLSLAGIAGIILSLGMSVDLNVLVFERMKEELKKGKMFKTAAELGFERAWPSIFDSNISTLITCAILFLIGTSIVRGFAVTLALGIIVSLFTGITVTRWFIRQLAKMPIAENPRYFGVKKPQGVS